MAFIDDARHSGRELYATPRKPWPRAYYTLAALGTSVLIWAIMIAVVVHQL